MVDSCMEGMRSESLVNVIDTALYVVLIHGRLDETIDA